MAVDRNLVPELIVNLVDRFVLSNSANEQFNLRSRLEAVRDFVDEALKQHDPNPIWNNQKKK